MRLVDFLDLFPERFDVTDDHMTVMTLSQRTQNDMTFWNDDVEEERENLLQNVCASVAVCSLLTLFGFVVWQS